MDLMSLLMPIIGGAISSGVIGKFVSKVGMGTITNLITGAIGGGGGSLLGLGAMLGGGAAAAAGADASTGMDLGAILGGLGTGAVGGGALQIVAGLAKNMMAKK